MRKPPPKKGSERNRQFGPRRINGQLLDLGGIAAYVGVTDKMARARIYRGEIPARKLGGRIVALRSELDAWMRNLPPVVEVARSERRASRPTPLDR
ncbi:MAG: helix-turn-helix domain-containing protein [Vicinamibacteria bacterium]